MGAGDIYVKPCHWMRPPGEGVIDKKRSNDPGLGAQGVEIGASKASALQMRDPSPASCGHQSLPLLGPADGGR